MELYIERENGVITLDEWLSCISSDRGLKLSEDGTVVNPVTKKDFKLRIRRRAVWRGTVEFTYIKGKVCCSNALEDITAKLSELAVKLSACVFDCGEKIFP